MIYLAAFIGFVFGLLCGWKWREHKARELMDSVMDDIRKEHNQKMIELFRKGKPQREKLDKNRNPTPE